MSDWLSTTAVMRAPQALAEEVWQGILMSVSSDVNGEEQPISARAVCCYAARGICHYGSTCDFLHDVSQLPIVGCQYKNACFHGHAASRAGVLAKHSSEAHDQLRKTLDGSSPGSYLECRGVVYEGTDVLWSEVATALTGESLSLGDGDLDSATRRDLAAESRYISMDDETADEWLCLPGLTLLDRLLASHSYLFALQWEWIVDEIAEARWGWTYLAKALSSFAQQAGQLDEWQRLISETAEAVASVERSFNCMSEVKKVRPDAVVTVRRHVEAVVRLLSQIGALFKSCLSALDAAEKNWEPDPYDADIAEQLAELRRFCDRFSLLLSGIMARSVAGVGDTSGGTTASSCSCLLDIVRESARRGEFILVHHVTSEQALDK